MVAEDEVRKHGTCELGCWDTESEHKLDDCELQEADHTDDQADDCVIAACGKTEHSPDTHVGYVEVNGPGVPAEEDHDTLQHDAYNVAE
eukprot:CAMPEP_0194506428 /NCGR_PEP_ID=MMETSP0253-20130528/34968_1 /TAXON_ID=2966 /ORGANISM="Noctiluca scintillans" /LENGTH=88 /DNA_ID=CAMNT_0039349173 /DNA_START=316 /DNA_END=582 /DNA_ORIENTATION=+